MLPMFIGLAEEGKIEIGGSEDFMVIGSKGTLDKFKGDKNGNYERSSCRNEVRERVFNIRIEVLDSHI